MVLHVGFWLRYILPSTVFNRQGPNAPIPVGVLRGWRIHVQVHGREEVSGTLGACRRSAGWPARIRDRKSTRLNSSHGSISYAVFCLKKNTYMIESLEIEIINN